MREREGRGKKEERRKETKRNGTERKRQMENARERESERENMERFSECVCVCVCVITDEDYCSMINRLSWTNTFPARLRSGKLSADRDGDQSREARDQNAFVSRATH